METTANKADEMLRATAANGEAVIYLARTSKLCDDARKAHNASPLASAVLGRALTMTAIMTLSGLKNDGDRLTVTLDGKGLIGKVVCGGRTPGLVKGYVEDPALELPLNEKGKLDVGWAVGNDGNITVIRDLGLKEPYVGRARIQTGEIAEDFAFYFTVSEQTPSLVALGVHVASDFHVDAAGGILVQPLPGCTEETLTKLEAIAPKLSSVSALMAEDKSLDDILADLFCDMEYHVLERHTPKFECDCSRERIEQALIAMGYDELKAMRDEDGQAELWCNFCNTSYFFSGEDLDALLDGMLASRE